MSKVQLFAVNNNDETVLLQLSDDAPIKMNLSVAEINPFTPSSFYSQVFRLPGIGQNIKFFQDVYSVNGTSFNPAAAAQAWILSDGALFSIGNLNIQAVYTSNRTGNIEYEVYFLGDTSDLATSIGEGGMNTIDASSLNHTLTYANVTGSWAATGGATAGLKDGNVLYPLIEWGYTYGTGATDKNLPVQNTLSHGFAESFTAGATAALQMEQLKPAIRVKWLFDKILSDAGYIYDSTFLDSDYFGSLYMVSDSVARPLFPNPSGTCQVTADTFTVNIATEKVVPFATTFNNLDQAFNTTTHIWTAPVAGTFDFVSYGKARAPVGNSQSSAAFKAKGYINGILVYDSGVLTTYGAAYREWTWDPIPLSLAKGDTVEVRIENMSFGNAATVFYDSVFNCIDGPNQVVMSSFLPDDTILKKIDFLRSVIRMFNLVFEPSKTVQKSFVIEPWIDWVQLGGILDWTRFFDGSSDLQASPVFFDQQRILKFGAADDEDWLNKKWQDQYKNDYMFRQFDSQIKLIKGNQEIDLQFAPTPLQSIPSKTTQYPNWVFPSLGRIQPGDPDQPSSGQMQPIAPRARIYHYNGLQSNPIPWYLYNGVSGSGTGVAQNSYPLVSPYSSWPPDQFSTVNLNFLSKQQLWSSASSYVAETSQDLYSVYWSEYVNWIYDPYNRKVSLTLRLSPAEVLGLKFNDRIWIKDTWYFVQMVHDYEVGDYALLKVDLVKVPGIAIPGPIPASATGGTGGTTCRTISLCNNNVASETGQSTYTYVDCDSNLASITLTDSSCAQPICMLYPLVNTLPSGWSASDNGSCGATGASLNIRMVNHIATILIENPITTVEVQGASAGTGGTYTTIQNFTFDGEQDFTVQIPDLPTGFGLRVRLSCSYAPGTALVSQFISLATNGLTGATAGRSGSYQPISATFPAVVSAANTYTAYVNITY
jgi:hypothetical protein